MVPACQNCNRDKADRTPGEWTDRWYQQTGDGVVVTPGVPPADPQAVAVFVAGLRHLVEDPARFSDELVGNALRAVWEDLTRVAETVAGVDDRW